MEHVIFRGRIKELEIDQIIRDYEYSMTSRHFHDTYELYYLLEGERYYFIDKETYLVKQGDVVLIKPNQIHKTSMAGNSYHNRILLQIQSQEINPVFQRNNFFMLDEIYARVDGIIHLEEDDRLRIEGLFIQINEEIQKKHKNYELMINIKLMELFLILLRYKKSGICLDNQPVQTAKYQKVHEVADYILSHCETDESLEELSNRFFISKSYLSRIFKEVTGFTVNEYLNITRIKKAQHLLTDSDYTITEIAEYVGYDSITYFERVFKKMTDITPLKYRKKHKY